MVISKQKEKIQPLVMIFKIKIAKYLKRILKGVVVGVSLLSFFGCQSVDKKLSDVVTTELKAQYNRSFVTQKIGDRLNTTHSLLQVMPENQKDLVFYAEYDFQEKIVRSEYINRFVGRQIEDKISEKCQRKGISLQLFATPFFDGDYSFGFPNYEINLVDFIQNYHPKSFMVKGIGAENINIEILTNTIQQISNDLKVNIVVMLWQIEQEKLHPAMKWLRIQPEFNQTLLHQKFGRKNEKSNEFNFSINTSPK